jgi:predicted CXXCH cytochrome family protein
MRATSAVIAVLLACAACDRSRDPAPPVRYVAESECAGCHPAEGRAWTGSHHDRAMEDATSTTVLGDFGDVTVEHGGTSTRFFRRDGAFFADTVGPDGARRAFQIRYTFGIEPLQQYLVDLPGGRLQALTVAWDTVRARWFDLYPDERPTPGDPLHWTGLYLNWNAQCAECHSTGLEKRYDAATDSYATRWAAIDVGCQACHGPGATHVAWARATAGHTPAGSDVGLVAAYVRRDAASEVESCAPCHARRHRVSGEDGGMAPFLDHYLPETLRDGLYHADGQILGEVYEYGSFVQSKMYARGVRCSDCHDPHSARLRAEGNALCSRCHDPDGDPRFPTLARKTYDAPSHHFHPDGSPGARCIACHMPSRHYMVVDERHDHSLRIPRPDLSERVGVPDPCTACHTDRSDRWAADAIAAHRGSGEPAPHPGETLAVARAGRSEARPGLLALAADTSQPAIVRATALELLAGSGRDGAAALAAATGDPDPFVRATAVGGLDRGGADLRRLAASRLADPVRAVRVQAARVLATPPRTPVGPQDDTAFRTALAEHEAALRLEADGPAAHLNLAVLAEGEQKPHAAEREYRVALGRDPRFLPARFNLATLLNAEGRNRDAETVLREGIALVPGDGELHYSLALLLAEMGRDADALAALGRAVELLPGRARVRYNYGLALQQRGRQLDAERALLAAHDLDPADADVVHALAIHYVQRGRRREGLRFARALAVLRPASPAAAELLRSLADEDR